MSELVTERLLLRGWRDADRAPWAELNADPEVRRYFPSVLDREASDESFERFARSLEERGWGLWAVEREGEFLGFTGLNPVSFAPLAGETEVGWRFARHAWGNGYATEAARAALDYAFGELECDEIVSFTALDNAPSIAVMERLGMTRDGTFEHPAIEVGHPLREHVLYRISKNDWRRAE